MKEPISVVVPVFNREKLIERSLNSILKQTYRPIELIVVDNKSTDKTLQIVERWKRRHETQDFSIKILTEEKRGACASRNRGLQEVRTKKMMFFDSDDTLRPECLEKGSEIFIEDPEVEIVVWQSMMHLLNGKKRKTKINPHDYIKSHILHGMLRPQGYMAQTSIFKEIGGWDEDLPNWNDWELGLRILLKNPKIKYIREVMSDIFSQEESITGKRYLDSKGKWEKSLEKIKKDIDESSHQEKEKLMRLHAYRTMILGAHYHREGDKEEGLKLLAKAINKDKTTTLQKKLLQIAYHYTRKGGRGAYHLIRL